MSGGTYNRYSVGEYFANEEVFLTDDGRYHAPGTRRCIIFRGGHGGRGADGGPLQGNYFYEITRMLADYGYTTLEIDAGGGNTWWNHTSELAMAAAVAYLQTKFGITKVGLFGGSMGGGVCLQALKTIHASVAGVASISGATDLDYFHGAGVSGYVPAYTRPVPDSFGNFTAVMEASDAYNCTHANWDSATAGHKIRDEYSTWHGMGVPIRWWHGDLDNVVPLGQTQAFINGVNDPLVTLRVLPNAYHTPWAPGPEGGYGPPLREYLDFYNSLTWT